MSRGLVNTPVQHPVCRPRGRSGESIATCHGIMIHEQNIPESYFFFVALSGGWCREEKNGRNKTGLLTYTILVDVEDQGGNDLWWSSSAGNRQLVSIPTGSFPSSAETVCLSENGCTSWSRQGDTRRNYLMRHGDASSRASVTITKALELLCLSPCFGRSHLLAEKSIYMYTYIYNFGI